MFLGTISMSLPCHISLALFIIQECPFFGRALAFLPCGALVWKCCNKEVFSNNEQLAFCFVAMFAKVKIIMPLKRDILLCTCP